MTNDITNSVNEIIAKYIDPQTKIPFNRDNSSINTNIKDGHVNVSININPIYKDNYAQLVTEMKNDLKKINEVIKNSKSDVVCLISTLEHLEDPNFILKLIKQSKIKTRRV